MTKKKKYFPNNWKAYKDSDDEMFYDHTFEEFMSWKVAGWELPSSVCCIIRVTDKSTKKIKEYVYDHPKAAMNFVGKLMEQGHEFTVVDDEAVHQMAPEHLS
tara:strand:- start:1437 stop:1742 length:306 start_codon:yes stop_codon:yes gene_type:complete